MDVAPIFGESDTGCRAMAVKYYQADYHDGYGHYESHAETS